MTNPSGYCITPTSNYEATAQIISNVAFIPPIVAAVISRNKSPNTSLMTYLTVSIFFFSSVYHTCDTTCACFNTPVYIFQMMDNIFANNGITVLFIALTTLSIASASVYYNRSSTFAGQVIYFLNVGFIVLIVSTSITGPNTELGPRKALLIILFIFATTMSKFIFVDDFSPSIMYKFRDPLVYSGLIVVLIGVVCFLLEIPNYTWVLHSFWHYCVGTGLTLVQMGSVMKLPDVTINRDGKLIVVSGVDTNTSRGFITSTTSRSIKKMESSIAKYNLDPTPVKVNITTDSTKDGDTSSDISGTPVSSLTQQEQNYINNLLLYFDESGKLKNRQWELEYEKRSLRMTLVKKNKKILMLNNRKGMIKEASKNV